MSIFHVDSATASAGTAFYRVVGPDGTMIPRITNLSYTCGATAHTLTIARPVGDTLTIEQSLSGESTITIDDLSPGKDSNGDDELLVAGGTDWVIYQGESGACYATTINTISGRTLTLTDALTEDVKNGAKVWALYEIGRATHSTLTMPVSQTYPLNGVIQAGYAAQTGIKDTRTGVGDVLLIHSNNITAAGVLVAASGTYSDATNVVVS